MAPRLCDIQSIYIFEGIRNSNYMSAFNPQSVIVIGSHIERQYAKSHGYGFQWSFPIVSATQAKMYRDWNYPILRQLSVWVNELSRFRSVVLFLYEDTQPLGVFLVHLGRALENKVTSVCIQHGYFANFKTELRYDGRLSDINFVWDEKHISIIGSNRNAAFVIGLPYAAAAAPCDELSVVLVGTGMAGDGNNHYLESLSAYVYIANFIKKSLGLKVYYRPHPNEWQDEDLLMGLRSKFQLLDDVDKVRRLNGPRLVFIGTVSSLLYEAGLAGHFVAHLKLYDKATPSFEYDFEFQPPEMFELLNWIAAARDGEVSPKLGLIQEGQSSMELFLQALHGAKLTDQPDHQVYHSG